MSTPVYALYKQPEVVSMHALTQACAPNKLNMVN